MRVLMMVNSRDEHRTLTLRCQHRHRRRRCRAVSQIATHHSSYRQCAMRSCSVRVQSLLAALASRPLTLLSSSTLLLVVTAMATTTAIRYHHHFQSNHRQRVRLHRLSSTSCLLTTQSNFSSMMHIR